MRKIFNFITNQKNTEKSPSRKSIVLRWAFANTIFCFVTFTIFTIIIFQMTMTTFVNQGKSNLDSTIDHVGALFEQAQDPLDFNNLRNFVDLDANHITDPGIRTTPTTYPSLRNMIQPRQQIYIYNTDKLLIYSTSQWSIPFHDEIRLNHISLVDNDLYSGYILAHELKSKSTGKTIGYIQVFSDMGFYYTLRNHLLISLTVLEVMALFIAQFVGYFMAKRFLEPLEGLHSAMLKVAQDPSEQFTPIEVKTGDEIEELADVYNDMMYKTNQYLDHQKRFVSDVSHELRTPLAVLDGHISLLNRWGKDDPEILDESLLASKEEITKMKYMLEEMLSLSRLQNLSDEYKEMTTDTEKSAKLIVRNFAMMHEDLDIKLHNRLDSFDEAKIYENHYEQALTILVDNAIKYSPADRKYIRIFLSEDENWMITEVRDKGLGISEGDIDFIFERFFRADKARNRDIGGTGLGLSIISRIVENYNGQILVTSELGEGSSFTLKLPRVKKAEVQDIKTIE